MRTAAFSLLLLLFFPCTTLPQNPESQLEYADSLKISGNYFQAVTEYKRLLFFDESRSHKYHANLSIADCYKAGGFLANAGRYYQTAVRESKNPDEAFRASVEYARILILKKRNADAADRLNLLKKSYKKTDQYEELNFWLGWAYFFDRDIENAGAYFDSAGARGAVIRSYLTRYNDESYNETLAQVLSYIIPGSGQIYTGEYISGMISMAWAAAGLYWSINSFIEERVLDSFFNGYFVFLRFYAGNLQNSKKFAIEKNNILLNSYLKEIENNYKGLLP